MSKLEWIRNRAFTAGNNAQGQSKRVLCVCAAGLLRSPTLAWVLSNPPYNFNTRSCGANPAFALIVLDDILIEWADTIIFVNPEVAFEAQCRFDLKSLNPAPEFITLDIPDDYDFRDPALVSICEHEAKKLFGKDNDA